MGTQICRVCKIKKSKSDYYKNIRYKDGKDTICKSCAKNLSKRVREAKPKYYAHFDTTRRRTNIDYIFGRRYSSMKFRISRGYMKKRSIDIPTKEQFLDWCYSPDIYRQFMRVYGAYKDSNFERRLIPTIDRKDTFLGYSLDNLQWMSHSDNARKAMKDYLPPLLRNKK